MGKPAHDISPVALETETRIDAIFDIEREVNGLDAAARLEARQRLLRPLVDSLHEWMPAERGRMSKHNPVANPKTTSRGHDADVDTINILPFAPM